MDVRVDETSYGRDEAGRPFDEIPRDVQRIVRIDSNDDLASLL